MKFTGFVTHSGRSSLVQKGCACYIYILYLRESGIQVLLTMNLESRIEDCLELPLLHG